MCVFLWYCLMDRIWSPQDGSSYLKSEFLKRVFEKKKHFEQKTFKEICLFMQHLATMVVFSNGLKY